MSHARRVRMKLRRSRRLFVGAVVLASLTMVALFAELIAADAPIVAIGATGVRVLGAVSERASYAGLSRSEIDALHATDAVVWPLLRQGPSRRSVPLARASSEHPLGTDGQGRDVMCELVYGARAAMAPTLFALLIATLVGCLFGGLAGYLGGFWDELLSRPIEVVQAFPTVVVVALAMAVDPSRSVWSLAFAIGAVRWAEIARVVRIETVRLAAQDYVLAARALGASNWRVVRRHILPQVTRSVVVCLVNGLPSLVLLEAAVSFLGIGVPSSWGTLIADGFTPNGSRFAAACAGAALVVTAMAAHLVAESVSDALGAKDPG